MITIPRHRLVVVNLIALALCAIPALAYWLAFERGPAIAPAQAQVLLAEPTKPTVLVDVRPATDFAKDHLPGAVNWPWSQIQLAADANWLPAELEKRRLLIICETGLTGSFATQRLNDWGLEAENIRGGMAAWTTPPTESQTLRPMSPTKQWIVVLTAFVIKPVYLLVALILIIWLWHRPAPDLTVLCWGLIWFWGGEQACSINWLVYSGQSEGWEYLHNYGMVVGFACVSWAAMEGVDRRIIHLSAENERCAALPLCRHCHKYTAAACGLRRVFLVSLPAAAVLALLPLTADFKLTSYGSNVLGAPVCYSHTMASQLFELRYCPSLAFLCFVASWLVLLRPTINSLSWSKVFFAAGMGALGFSLMRMALVATFSDDLMWFDTWEEWTELIFVLGVAWILWVFRPGLMSNDSAASSQPASATV